MYYCFLRFCHDLIAKSRVPERQLILISLCASVSIAMKLHKRSRIYANFMHVKHVEYNFGQLTNMYSSSSLARFDVATQ